MSLKELHKWVIIRLFVISVLFTLIAFLINNYTWNKEISSIFANSLWLSSIINLIAIIIFSVVKPKNDITEDEYKELYSNGKLSRNLYLFSIIMFISGLMSFSSSAGRVAYLFFVLGTIILPVAHLVYFNWIKKFTK